MLKEVGLANFSSEVLQHPSPVLVDFYSAQCSPCRAILPALEAINGPQVKVVKLNIEDEPELTEHFNVKAVPTVVAFSRGKEINRTQGLKSKDQLLNLALAA